MVGTPDSAEEHKNIRNVANNIMVDKDGDMPPEDRENAILRFLHQHGFPLPPKALYRAMKIKHNITFSYRTVQNILSRLTEEGYAMRCDKDALDLGKIEPVPEDENTRRTYYYLTDKGRERINEDDR